MKNNVNKKMPSTSRPRVSGGSGNIGRIGTPNAPMSERQQMALLMQMTSPTNSPAESPPVEPPKPEPYKPARSRDRNERGETPIHVAAIKGDQEGCKKLLDQGWTPLHEACNHGHYNVALALVKSGANVNARGLDDDTPLHDAAIVGQLKMVKMLVDRGADVTFKNRKGKSPVDVASSAVYDYLVTAQEQQLMKKLNEAGKKSPDGSQDESNVASGSGTTTKTAPKEEEDVYEFKTTPKDSSSSGDDKSDGGKSSDKSSDEKSDDQASKRSYSDIEVDGDDEVKRKKRKDGEAAGKEANKSAANRPQSQRQEKNSKLHGAAAKNSNLANKNVSTLERKSPCASPKPAATKADSDVEMDDKSLGGDSHAAGPKVPPLKIVIPQQTTSQDPDLGTRNGKNISTRNSAALPYVVASSSNSNDSADKESVSSRCTSPSDSTKGADEKKLNTSALTNEDQKQQRVLRSSNRGGSSSVDRSSNNSSPQMQSSSPSPAPVTQTSTTTTTATSTTASVTTESGDAVKTSTTSAPSVSGTNTTSPSNSNAGNELETINAPSPSASSTSSTKESSQNTVDLHPRKRKIRASKDENQMETTASSKPQAQLKNEEISNEVPHPHDQPITNCYQMYLNIRKQIERRQRNLMLVQPKPPQGFKDYLLNRRSYVLAGKSPIEPTTTFPLNISSQLKELYKQQERDRHKLKMQHVVEKEKLVLSVEQEILRVHGRAARALANQSLPFSACTILKDEEIYNIITPEQEEKDRNARSRYNGRLFLSWLQDVDDKWEKIKEAMVLRHHNEAESLHAVQKMEWEWKMKELMLCEYKVQPIIEENYVPMVHVSDDFDLLP